MRLILPLLIARKMPYQIIFLAINSHLVGRYLPTAFVFNERLKLFDSVVFKLHALLSVSVDSVVCFEFFLELNDCFVSLVQSGSQSDHDVSLLEQKLLVAVNLLFVFFYLNTFLFDFLHFLIVLFAYHALSFFESVSKLRSVFHFLATNEELAVHGSDLLFKKLLLFLFLHEFTRSHLKSCDSSVLVFLSSSLFFFQLHDLLVTVDICTSGV